jgi:alpha-tubulin suppressor-like RCC1 family protein
MDDGSVMCWGDGGPNLNYTGTGTSYLAGTISGIGNSAAFKVVGGYAHTCALETNGTAKCWGLNNHGELGNGSTATQYTPVVVSGLSGAGDITAGNSHTCAVQGGQVLCWGGNSYGQLGVGDTNDRSTPTAVSGISDAIAVSAQSWTTCALHASGTVSCWGYGTDGELGNGTNTASQLTPVPVSNLTGVTALASSGSDGYHSCTIGASLGLVHCWGWNHYGQLGNGTTTNSNVPVAVSGGLFGLGTARSLAVGSYHSCAALLDTGVVCWGDGTNGALGNGTWNSSSIPVTVLSLSTEIADLTAGYQFSCARLATGAVDCWGWNYYGTLGNGTTTNSNTPVAVSNLSGAISLGSGADHNCAILAGGAAECWGGDFYGQLGNGTTTQQLTPGAVLNFP